MKVFFAFLLLSSLLSPGIAQTESFTHRIIDTNGVSNIIFASEKISVGMEDLVNLKTTFINGEAIWGRAYFPQSFGLYKACHEDDFCLDLYIDDYFVQRVIQEHPESDWGQMQVWLNNTNGDYFPLFIPTLEQAGAGSHKVTIIIGLNRFQGTKDVAFSGGDVEKEMLFTLQPICKGTIQIITD
ncbi:MAG: hypothetical protein CVU05_03695 [Bacteroidetes bacterium HGW-Bacteroidetes-21]|jgi:hypothetical protein|nr:MAG: hypothetical protein CVU05_03695 [Bacteroidetes bacterium HGW-Bacteroidetes-21]